MSLPGLLDHLLNFVLPALVVGGLLAALAPLLLRKLRPHHSWLVQSAINAASGLLVLLAGLVVFGHDGKMATYSALVLACASSQWIAGKAWRA
ncbi:MAG: hypothetical protein HXX19_13210 [Rhodoferax sp.]|nr:hypothetical protein [Rhodoferax sp.]